MMDMGAPSYSVVSQMLPEHKGFSRKTPAGDATASPYPTAASAWYLHFSSSESFFCLLQGKCTEGLI